MFQEEKGFFVHFQHWKKILSFSQCFYFGQKSQKKQQQPPKYNPLASGKNPRLLFGLPPKKLLGIPHRSASAKLIEGVSINFAIQVPPLKFKLCHKQCIRVTILMRTCKLDVCTASMHCTHMYRKRCAPHGTNLAQQDPHRLLLLQCSQRRRPPAVVSRRLRRPSHADLSREGHLEKSRARPAVGRMQVCGWG